MSRGVLVVVSGFSGAGKGTIMKSLMAKYDNYALSVSATTRNPRPGEEDGREYFFRTREEFEEMIRQDQLIEYAQYRKIRPEELLEVLDRIQESAKGMKTLEEWENYIEDYTKKLAEQAKKQETKREGIVISTLHAVKGLEYDKVYIMNVNEGSIPYKKAVLAESLEEERRLFYVGMTRAKKELMLCYVRRQYDKERDPSRFLEETGLF